MLANRAFVAAFAALIVSGCSVADRRDGAGTDLYSVDSIEGARLEDIYLNSLCQRAGLAGPATSATACSQPLRGEDWTALAQAGLNDIDQRCDTYLAWLDNQRRSTAPILQQISDVRTTTVAIMAASGVGASPIAIVAAAFGLASSTFNNVQTSLLTQMNQATVQSIVLNRQNQFRRRIGSQSIATRPAAVHAMRSYLRICMPFTIETEINTTITTFERVGGAALDRSEPLIRGDIVGRPLKARDPVKLQVRATPAATAGMENLIANYDAGAHYPNHLKSVFRKICATEPELADLSSPVNQQSLKNRIATFERAIRLISRKAKDSVVDDGKLSDPEMRLILSHSNLCNALKDAPD